MLTTAAATVLPVAGKCPPVRSAAIGGGGGGGGGVISTGIGAVKRVVIDQSGMPTQGALSSLWRALAPLEERMHSRSAASDMSAISLRLFAALASCRQFDCQLNPTKKGAAKSKLSEPVSTLFLEKGLGFGPPLAEGKRSEEGERERVKQRERLGLTWTTPGSFWRTSMAGPDSAREVLWCGSSGRPAACAASRLGSSWFDLSARKMSAVAWGDRDQMMRRLRKQSKQQSQLQLFR